MCRHRTGARSSDMSYVLWRTLSSWMRGRPREVRAKRVYACMYVCIYHIHVHMCTDTSRIYACVICICISGHNHRAYTNTATCKIHENFQRFSTADLYQSTAGTPSERFLFVLRVAVCADDDIHSQIQMTIHSTSHSRAS